MSAARRSAQRRRSKSAQQRRDLIALRERSQLIAALMTLPFLDPEKCAVVADVHPATIRRACDPKRGGTLQHTRVNGGKLIRIAPDDLRAWLSSGSRQKSAA